MTKEIEYIGFTTSTKDNEEKIDYRVIVRFYSWDTIEATILKINEEPEVNDAFVVNFEFDYDTLGYVADKTVKEIYEAAHDNNKNVVGMVKIDDEDSKLNQITTLQCVYTLKNTETDEYTVIFGADNDIYQVWGEDIYDEDTETVNSYNGVSIKCEGDSESIAYSYRPFSMSAGETYELPAASATTLGGVKIRLDGTTLYISTTGDDA